MGFIGSDTRACSGWDSTGSLKPAIFASTPELPAATQPTVLAPMKPRLVSTPSTLPPLMRKPVTSVCCSRSTPSASAPRAKPQATAS